MGEYADEIIDAGMDDWGPSSSRKSRTEKGFAYIHYHVERVIKETDGARLVLFKGDVSGIVWSHAFWFPKSQTELYDAIYPKGEKRLMVPAWLIEKKFAEGGVKV